MGGVGRNTILIVSGVFSGGSLLLVRMPVDRYFLFFIIPHLLLLIVLAFIFSEFLRQSWNPKVLPLLLVSRKGLYCILFHKILTTILLVGLISGFTIAVKVLLHRGFYLTSEQWKVSLIGVQFYWLALLFYLNIFFLFWWLPTFYRMTLSITLCLISYISLAKSFGTIIEWTSYGSVFEMWGHSLFSPFSIIGLYGDEISAPYSLVLSTLKILIFSMMFCGSLLLILYFSLIIYQTLSDVRIIPIYKEYRWLWGTFLSIFLIFITFGGLVFKRQAQNIVYLANAPLSSSKATSSFPAINEERKRQIKLAIEREKAWVIREVNISIEPSSIYAEIVEQIFLQRLGDVQKLKFRVPFQYHDLSVRINGNPVPPERLKFSHSALTLTGFSFPEQFQLLFTYQIPLQLFEVHQGHEIATITTLDCNVSKPFVKLPREMLFRRPNFRSTDYLSGRTISVTAEFGIPLINHGELFPIRVSFPSKCSHYRFSGFHQVVHHNQIFLSAEGDSIIDIYGYDEAKSWVATDLITIEGANDFTPDARNQLRQVTPRLSNILSSYGFSAPLFLKSTCFSLSRFPTPLSRRASINGTRRDFFTFYLLSRCVIQEISPYLEGWKLNRILAGILTYKAFVENGWMTKSDFMEQIRAFVEPLQSPGAPVPDFYDLLSYYLTDKKNVDVEISHKLKEVSEILLWLRGKSFDNPYYSMVHTPSSEDWLPLSLTTEE